MAESRSQFAEPDPSPEELFLLNRRDRELLQDALLKVNTRHTNETMRPPVLVDSPHIDVNAAPETYIAFTPTDGIPGIQFVGTSSGPPTDVTGAECQIYQIDNINGVLKIVRSFTHLVYNLSTQTIPGKKLVLIHRDKYGYWIATLPTTLDSAPGEEAGGGICQFAKLSPDDCIIVHTFDPDAGAVDYYLEYNSGTQHWTSADEFTYPGGIGVFDFYYEGGRFHLRLDDIELLDCGDGCFTGGWITGHVTAETGTDAVSVLSCNNTTFTVCIECGCCVIDGWDGEGWYCVSIPPNTGTADIDCLTAYLFDPCDDTYHICSGRYDTEVAALAVCGSITGTGTGSGTGTSTADTGTISVACCPSDLISGTLNVTVTDKTGTCTCLPDSFTIAWNGSIWIGTVVLCGNSVDVRLACNTTTWNWSATSGAAWSKTISSWSCSPFVGVFSAVNIVGPCTGTATFTITG